MKKIYIMLSKTESVFCALINSYTKEPYAHVSLIFSDDFKSGYSFSRKNIHNPFFGGFMIENYVRWVKKFPLTECRMYELYIPEENYTRILNKLAEFELEKEKYKYNLVGVLGYMFNIKIQPKYRYFCSQFVSYILQETQTLDFGKEPICTTAIDFKNHPQLALIYEGYLNQLIANPSLLYIAS